MSYTLKYKLPFEEVTEKKGVFRSVHFSDLPDGFIVTNFDKSKAYFFDETMVSEENIDSKQFAPIVYTKEEYLEKAEKFVQVIRENCISKAILSRIKSVQSKIDPDVLFRSLCVTYPSAFVYQISSDFFGNWIGATPEALLSCNRDSGLTVALAGTMKTEDQLPWGDKERIEQQFVTDFIEEHLLSLNIKSIRKDGPYDRIAGPVKHLETCFNFSMEGQYPISVADKLHPTPAVSGLPQGEALELINQIESHDRSLYAGCIGILGERTDLFVNLRCAQLIGNEIFLYLGGGFTTDSIPEMEWQETENKSRTLLDIIENS